MPDHIRWEWLDRYFSGECTAEEAGQIEQWIAAGPERRRHIEALREVWRRSAGPPDRRWDPQAAWQRIAPTLDVPALGTEMRRRLTVIPGLAADAVARSRRRAGYLFRIAAAIGIMVGGTTVGWLALSNGLPTGAPRVSAFHDYSAPRGQRVSLALADGTRIVLAPGSSLRAPRDFAHARRRDVHLEGEALFEVKHDASRPFVVHSAHGTTEDVGTRFVVTAYAADTTMRVVVAEGAVAVRGPAGSAAATPELLHPGDLAVVDPEGRVATAHDVAVGDYFGWTTGQLVFRDTPVQDVMTTLARWYDVDVRIDPAAATAVATRRVTLTTEPGQPLAEILVALAVPAGLRVRQLGRAIVVGP